MEEHILLKRGMYNSKLVAISDKFTSFSIEVQLIIETQYQKAIANSNSYNSSRINSFPSARSHRSIKARTSVRLIFLL